MRTLVAFVVLSSFCLNASDAADKSKYSEAETRAIENPTVDSLPLLFQIVKKETHCFPKTSPAISAIVGLKGKAVPSIIAELEASKNGTWKAPVRYLYYLALIGPEADAARPILHTLTDTPKGSKYVQHYARAALAAAVKNTEALTRMATNDKDMGGVALQALASMKSEAREAAPALAAHILKRHKQWASYVDERYVQALRQIDPQRADEVAKKIAEAK